MHGGIVTEQGNIQPLHMFAPTLDCDISGMNTVSALTLQLPHLRLICASYFLITCLPRLQWLNMGLAVCDIS